MEKIRGLRARKRLMAEIVKMELFNMNKNWLAYQVSVLVFVFQSDVIGGTQLIPENSLHHQDKLVVGDVLKQETKKIHLLTIGRLLIF